MLRATMIIDYPTCEELVGHLVDDILVFPSTSAETDDSEQALQNEVSFPEPAACSDGADHADEIQMASVDEKMGR